MNDKSAERRKQWLRLQKSMIFVRIPSVQIMNKYRRAAAAILPDSVIPVQVVSVIKQRDGKGNFLGTRLKAIYGDLEKLVELPGKSTAYVERAHLTMRTFSSRLTRKSIAFS
jgi:hypothetical protein